MAVQAHLMTAETLAAMPNNDKRYELVEGILIEMSPVNYPHGFIALAIGSYLRSYVLEKNLGGVTVETGYILFRNPDTVRAPDVAYLSKARLAKPNSEGFIPVAPDLAVEVVSPGDTADEVAKKVDDYLAAGTPIVWVVYPGVQKVYVHTGDGAKRIDINGVLDGGELLLGFVLPMRNVFEGLEG